MNARERPILFSGPMVKAVLDGSKTQTRRTRSLNRVNAEPDLWTWVGINKFGQHIFYLTDEGERKHPDGYPADFDGLVRCPYGILGDRLWVKEQLRGDGQSGDRRVGIVRYGTDGEMVLPCAGCGMVRCERKADCFAKTDVIWEWKRLVLSARFMPKWACRLWLEVTDVRIEQVQDISDKNIRAEGVRGDTYPELSLPCPEDPRSAKIYFMELWDSINAKRGYGWDVNPWVWVISFKRLEGR